MLLIREALGGELDPVTERVDRAKESPKTVVKAQHVYAGIGRIALGKARLLGPGAVVEPGTLSGGQLHKHRYERLELRRLPHNHHKQHRRWSVLTKSQRGE